MPYLTGWRVIFADEPANARLLEKLYQTVNRIDQIGYRPLLTTMVFSPTDADTLAWTAGNIVWADGEEGAVNAGNTGNLAAGTHFLYYDGSPIMQTTTNYGRAIDRDNAVVGVCQVVSGAKKIYYSVFGSRASDEPSFNELHLRSLSVDNRFEASCVMKILNPAGEAQTKALKIYDSNSEVRAAMDINGFQSTKAGATSRSMLRYRALEFSNFPPGSNVPRIDVYKAGDDSYLNIINSYVGNVCNLRVQGLVQASRGYINAPVTSLSGTVENLQVVKDSNSSKSLMMYANSAWRTVSGPWT